jgi:hypothetical protein
MHRCLVVLFLALSAGAGAEPTPVGLAGLLGTAVRDPGREAPAGTVRDLVLRDGRLEAVILARDPGRLDGPPDFVRLPAQRFAFAADADGLRLRATVADPGFLDHHAAPPPLDAGERSVRRLVERPLALAQEAPWARLEDVEIGREDRAIVAFVLEPASEGPRPPLPAGSTLTELDGRLRFAPGPGAPFEVLDRWLRGAPPGAPVPGSGAPPVP